MSMSSALPDSQDLECPVCFNQLVPPIFQCTNGHLLCNDCIDKVESCPVCRVNMPQVKIRNLIAERAAAGNPRGALFSDARDGEFRGLRVCKYLGFPECTQELLENGIVSHLKALHGLGSVHTQDGQYIEVVQIGMNQAQIDGRTVEAEWPPLILLPRDYPPLVLKTKLSADCLSWTISAVYSEERVSRLTAKIILVPNQEEITSLTWKGPISTLKDNNVDKNSFCAPMSKIRGLNHWSLLVKIALKPLLTPEREVSDVSIIEPRPPVTFVPSRTPGPAHPGINCDGCRQNIKGARFKCLQCSDYDLCQSCYIDRKIHLSRNHVFFALPTPNASSAFNMVTNLDSLEEEPICDGCNKVLMGLRFKCTECADFDLCPQCCLQRNLHSHHLFLTAHTRAMDDLIKSNTLLKGVMHSAMMRYV